ncbi:MAG: hypothetical protein QME96_18030 [Myxococcota bacterium]|nr:hypothetical protein [Myxococcota bacterium]
MRRLPKVIVPAVVCLGLAHTPPAVASEGAASGFMIQGLVGGTRVWSSFRGMQPFAEPVSVLRIGGMWDTMAVAANVSFFAVAQPEGDYEGIHVLSLGPDLELFVWSSADGAARLYVLAGFNLGVGIDEEAAPPSPDPEFDETEFDFVGGFCLGLGGHYFLHRNFALGVEIGSRTLFIDDPIIRAISSLYAALSITFVAGD